MNQHAGDLTPSVTPTITPVVNTAEKSKESTITIVPPTQEYLDSFSHDVATIQKFTKDHPEMDAEFIANFNKEIDDAIQSHPPSYDFIVIINRLPMEKTNMVANYLNLYYGDDDMKRLIAKPKRKLKDDIEISQFVFSLYALYDDIKNKRF
jgi:hypothetical protein